MKDAGKKIHLEVIRIIALICIIYNHTGDRGNNIYLFTNGNITFAFSLITDILCRIGVPLFLMVSGALLLQKEESWQDIYRKRVLRIVKVIVWFTVIRYFYECFYVKKMMFSFLELIKLIFTGKLFLPYWFLYAYLSILLVLPLLKKMVKNMDKKEMDILTILIFVFYTVLPVISAVFALNFEISFVFGISCCYCFLGYYLENVISSSSYTKKNAILAMLIIVGSVAFSYWMVVREKGTTGVIADGYTGILSILIAFCVFFIIKAVWSGLAVEKDNACWKKWLTNIGSCAFGIYLIEDYLRNGLSFVYDIIAPYTTTLPACVVWLAVVMMAGVIIVSLLKKLPVLKDIL